MSTPRSVIESSVHEACSSAGSSGSAILLSGPAGAGKSFLARRVLEALDASVLRLTAEASPTGSPSLLPICQAISGHVFGRLQGLVRPLVEATLRELPILRELLGMSSGGRAPVAVDPLGETRVFIALERLLSSLAVQVRTVLFVDDIQWLDTSSMAFLEHLSSKSTEPALCVLMSARANGVEPAAVRRLRSGLTRRSATFTHHHLAPMTADECLAACGVFLGAPLTCSDSAAQWLVDVSLGRPQYLREVLIRLKDERHVVQTGGGWLLMSLPDEKPLPPALARLILGRLDDAAHGEPHLDDIVAYGAICGSEFDASFLSGLVELPRSDVRRALKALAGKTALVERIGRSDRWRFGHEVTREAVLASLGDSRATMHAEVARALRGQPGTHPVRMAYHWRHAGRFDRAATAYGDAAAEAERVWAQADAVRLSQVACEMWDQARLEPEDRRPLDARLAAADILVRARRYDEAIDLLGSAQQSAGASIDVRLAHRLARARIHRATEGDIRAARSLLDAALARLTGDEFAGSVAELEAERLMALDAAGDPHGSMMAWRRALVAARRAEDTGLLIRLMRLSCMFWRPEKVITVTRKAMALARARGMEVEATLCANNIGCQYWMLGRFRQAATFLDRARSRLQRLGGYFLDVPLTNLGLVALCQGRLGEGLATLEEALDVRAGDQDVRSRLISRIDYAAAVGMNGDPGTARALLADCARDASHTGDAFFVSLCSFNLARAMEQMGQWEEGLRILTRAPNPYAEADDRLAEGMRAGLLCQLAEGAGHRPDPQWVRAVQNASLSTRPTRWLYAMDWALCDLQFWKE